VGRGRGAEDVLSADPKTYGRHIYDLVQRVEEVGAEVVFYDGIEAEAFAYGAPHAASLNARKLAVLSKAGVSAVLSGARSLGLASAVDVAAKASGDPSRSPAPTSSRFHAS
jgi:predicted metal-dependent phosphotriesterase family hydrolase